MDTCVPVRFDHGPKHHLAAFRGEPPELDARVVVATRKGPRLARVRGRPKGGRAEVEVLRLATEEDLARHREQTERAVRLKWRLKPFFRKRLPKLKLVAVEYTLDGRVAFLYVKGERRSHLGAEVKELARLAEARVEAVVLGDRDEVAILGALGACGLTTCCSTWLQEFGPSTIRMARDQQLPLSPEKISGPCGRLLCCIAYEHPVYRELLAKLPKKNARVCTKAGVCGKVAKHFPLKLEVELKTPSGGRVVARAEDLVPWKEEA